MLAGIVPDIALDDKSRFFKEDSNPSSLGMVPLIELEAKYILSREGPMLPREWGIEPV